MSDHNQDSKPAEPQLLWDPVQLFQFPSDTLEGDFSCVKSTCIAALQELHRESRTGSHAKILNQQYEKLARTRPADIRPVDLQSLAELVLCSCCRSRDIDIWIESWAKQIGCWRVLLRSRNGKISALEAVFSQKEEAHRALVKKTHSLRRQRVSDSSRAATDFILEETGAIFPMPIKPEEKTDEQMNWRLKFNEELALGWRWNPIVTLRLRHDYVAKRYFCKGDLRNANGKCNKLISEWNHRYACLLLDQNARLKPESFGIKEPNTWEGLGMLEQVLQCEEHSKDSPTPQRFLDKWYRAVSNEARVRREYDDLINRIATLKPLLSQSITGYRKVLYDIVEELLEKQEWACSDMETEFTIMRDVYTALEKKLEPLDKELNDLRNSLNALYDEFQEKEETWGCGGWYE